MLLHMLVSYNPLGTHANSHAEDNSSPLSLEDIIKRVGVVGCGVSTFGVCF